jgi:hypothetical protein
MSKLYLDRKGLLWVDPKSGRVEIGVARTWELSKEEAEALVAVCQILAKEVGVARVAKQKKEKKLKGMKLSIKFDLAPEVVLVWAEALGIPKDAITKDAIVVGMKGILNTWIEEHV